MPEFTGDDHGVGPGSALSWPVEIGKFILRALRVR
jgi:hypothetical protein